MTDLTVSLIQTHIDWEAPAANRERYTDLINRIEGKTDLIVLPEMFTTGFTMAPAPHAEPMDGPSMTWMADMANKTNAAIVGSLIIEKDKKYYNRLVFMHPAGHYDCYDKRHPFKMSGEHEHYTTGDQKLIVNYRGWRIRPLICYDLRFPVWARNDGRPEHYDLLLYVANWPDKRAHDWRVLLQARAIENQAYVVGVNRVGADENGHEYNGDSCVISPGWLHVLASEEKMEWVWTERLSAKHLGEVRTRLPFLTDGD